MLRTESCPLQNTYVEALTPTVTVYGNGAFREVIKLNDVIRVGP